MTITLSPTAGAPTRTTMQVRKRNGDTEPVDVTKTVRAIDRVSHDLPDVDPMRVATRTISGLYDGATTDELDRLSIQTSAEMIGELPAYSKLAARLLSGYIEKKVRIDLSGRAARAAATSYCNLLAVATSMRFGSARPTQSRQDRSANGTGHADAGRQSGRPWHVVAGRRPAVAHHRAVLRPVPVVLIGSAEPDAECARESCLDDSGIGARMGGCVLAPGAGRSVCCRW